ncbi:MAG TPA: tRNA (N6-isopentenyl adenosine(37)-C2)-methylthiotransferase MiaB [Rhodospirillaceae bacterium]|jgi:tRNA-2-methylthio-N6-dimethylallyladenosine synthase|nr:tRNA (N6-isopentenyl adenosine(37)-C2)-methylthiotransferase MiaB [Alphaproteobacteria bacterium]HBH26417.1 tRNA (N6-isopentenyl adenosine(37)-C2)-methylthiotransferase MiaB [Rhodospirillaceae bacterium]
MLPPVGKTLYIRSWGCQMNAYDARRMAGVLAPLGYTQVPEPEGADLIILNTCHIREKAEDKVFSELGRLRPLKDKRPGTLIAVGGCVAQAEGALIQGRAPFVDIVFGPQTWHRLPEMVAKALKERVINTDFPAEVKFDFLPEEHAPPGPSAFLPVQEGCDRFCTFCVVPYTRGAEYTRPAESIMGEARRLVDAGALEIVLLGQNVNAYPGLAGLIEKLSDIRGLERIRYTTSHPLSMTADLIAAHRACPKLMPFLHLPIQSGSDRILKSMNRKHTSARYQRIVENLRAARPDIALSSDFIVGFPGETDEDFNDTIRLVSEITFASAYSFAYSPRPGTPAAAMPGQVPPGVKAARLAQLQALLNDQQEHYNRTFIGKVVPVLFEKKGKKHGQLLGRSPHGQAVHALATDGLIGTIAPVRITRALPNSLAAEPAPPKTC